MTLAKAKAKAKAKVKHIYSTGDIYDRHLQSSKYFYNTGHRISDGKNFFITRCISFQIKTFNISKTKRNTFLFPEWSSVICKKLIFARNLK
jgi:hypothetical protein